MCLLQDIIAADKVLIDWQYMARSKVHFSLPDIYKTNILNSMELNIRNSDGKSTCIIVQAPTGYGKTFGTIRTVARLTRELGYKVPASFLFPFRAGIKPMYERQLLANIHLEDHVDLGYGMRHDTDLHPTDEVCLYTVGYWLELFLGSIKNSKIEEQIIVVDEAHDSTWQTDLALRLIMHYIRQGAKIKLIISSATLDVADLFSGGEAPQLSILSTDEDTKANIDTVYGSTTFEVGNTLSSSNYSDIKKGVDYAWEKTSGNIIVMMPGVDDIRSMIALLEKDIKYDGITILELHSGLASDDIYAATHPSAKGRTIIVSTNIIENSITIDQVDAVVDSCYRKLLFVEDSGIKALKLVIASKTNIKQAAGRCGRQGKKGLSYLTLTDYQFATLPFSTINEVHRNPLYNQIIRLVSSDVSPYTIFDGVKSSKITSNINFLIKHQAVERVEVEHIPANPIKPTKYNEVHYDIDWSSDESDDDSYVTLRVTKIGNYICKFPLSISAGQFMAMVLTTLPKDYWYTGAIIAAWIDESNSIFYRPARKPRQTQQDYTKLLDETMDKQREVYENDCMDTMVTIWYKAWSENPTTKTFHEWCKTNAIFDRTITSIQSNVKHIMKTAKDMGHPIEEPITPEACRAALKLFSTQKPKYVDLIGMVYTDWRFKLNIYGEVMDISGCCIGKKRSIDKFIPMNRKDFTTFYSLNLKQINNFIALSKIVIADSVTPTTPSTDTGTGTITWDAGTESDSD